MNHYTDITPNFPSPEDWTLATVLRTHASATPDASCLLVPEEGLELTYAAALRSAEQIAGSWHASGADRGDRVAIMALNSSSLVLSWWATAVGGTVQVPVNTNYEGEFLRHQLTVSAPRWAVIDDDFADRFLALDLDADPNIAIEKFWVIDNGAGAAAIARLQAAGLAAAPWDELLLGTELHAPAPQPQDLGAIFFTSGTTGPSKGVAMPHAQLYFFAQEVVSLTRLTAADRYLTTTPLFHGNAQFMAVFPALVAGASAVIRRKFSASRWIDNVRDSGVTVTNFVGVMMDFAWKQPPRENDRDNRLRCIYAAPIASSIEEDFKARYGIETFVNAFGLTETSAPILSPYGVDIPAGAAGLQASDWFDIRLVDPETDREVQVGQVGELVVRPRVPWICSMGYYGMPEKTVEAWRNLWFHTGDALRQDAAGWYYFVDRYKDALRRRGENISSYEVEQVVLGHPAVRECAVIGVPADVEAGEDEVLAAVVVNQDVSPAEILDFCDGRIPAFARPRYIRVVDDLPKTPSEKVRKSVLRDQGVPPGTYDAAASPVPVPAHADRAL